jgi:hypothetical protein
MKEFNSIRKNNKKLYNQKDLERSKKELFEEKKLFDLYLYLS